MCSVAKYLVQSPIKRGHLGPPAVRGAVRPLVISDCQVGFPIRTSRDQRVLSPPPGLSQSATSFIASCCQGIHQTPLSRLIRSRRRQALLRVAGSATTHRPSSGRKSLTRRRSLGRGGAAVASPERSSTRQDPRSVSFDLERLLSLQRTLWFPARRSPHSANARTASRVLLSSRCQCLVAIVDRTGRLIAG
jgi:hypothetical protein